MYVSHLHFGHHGYYKLLNETISLRRDGCQLEQNLKFDYSLTQSYIESVVRYNYVVLTTCFIVQHT